VLGVRDCSGLREAGDRPVVGRDVGSAIRASPFPRFALPVGEERRGKSLQLRWKSAGIKRITLMAETEGSCLAPVCPQLEFRQEKQKRWEVNRVHAQGTSFRCFGPSISLSEDYHAGDAFNKGARTVIGCQSPPETCLQPLLGVRRV